MTDKASNGQTSTPNTDIHGQREAERYGAVLDALSDLGEGLVITEAGRLIYANEAYRRMTGYSHEELAARSNLIELAPPHLRQALGSGLGEILSGKRDPSHFLESQLVTKAGEVVDVESSIHMLPAETETRILAIVRDITERKRIQAELQQLNEDLERRVDERTAMLEVAQDELDAFSYSVSHDLRAPLRAIHGFSGILTEEHRDEMTPESQRLVGLINENAALMGSLVDSLLALARMGRREMRPQVVGTRAIAQRALDRVLVVHPGAEVRVSFGELPALRADEDLLEQLFVALIDNAVKFSMGRPNAAVRVSSKRRAEEVTFTVSDNGVGFDPRYVDKIFGVFQRLVRPEDYDGVGVGLAIARRIVERHGGRIWADARRGSGADFHFTIPPLQPAVNAPRSDPA